MVKQFSLVETMHRPLPPYPRRSRPEEGIFADAWAELMSRVPDDSRDDVTMLDFVLGEFPLPVEQRQATIAATFICWLSTNCGRAFLGSCESMRASNLGLLAEDAYLLAWTKQNARVHFSNCGFRMVEHLLAETADRDSDGSVIFMPTLTPLDYEVFDYLVVWLATADGRDFIKGCEHRVHTFKTAERAERFKAAHEAKQTKGSGPVAGTIYDPASGGAA